MQEDVREAIRAGLALARQRPMRFALAPNGGKPILLLRRSNQRPLLASRFRKEAAAEGQPYEAGAIYVGQVERVAGILEFTIEPDLSKGQLSTARFLRSLQRLRKQTKLAQLSRSRVRLGDEVESDEVEDAESDGDGGDLAPDDSGETEPDDVWERMEEVVDDLVPSLLDDALEVAGDPDEVDRALDALRPLRDEILAFLARPDVAKLPEGPFRMFQRDRVRRAKEALATMRDAVKDIKKSTQGSAENPQQTPVAARLGVDVSALPSALADTLTKSENWLERRAVPTREQCLQLKAELEKAPPSAALNTLRYEVDDRLVELELQQAGVRLDATSQAVQPQGASRAWRVAPVLSPAPTADAVAVPGHHALVSMLEGDLLARLGTEDAVQPASRRHLVQLEGGWAVAREAPSAEPAPEASAAEVVCEVVLGARGDRRAPSLRDFNALAASAPPVSPGDGPVDAQVLQKLEALDVDAWSTEVREQSAQMTLRSGGVLPRLSEERLLLQHYRGLALQRAMSLARARGLRLKPSHVRALYAAQGPVVAFSSAVAATLQPRERAQQPRWQALFEQTFEPALQVWLEQLPA